MTAWLPESRVRHRADGRVGTVVGEPGLYSFPTVRWDNGTQSDIDADLLVRDESDWLLRALANVPRWT